MMTAPTITLGKCEATLVRPSALAALGLGLTREQIEASEPVFLTALGAAALWLSWPQSVTWPVRVRPAPWGPGTRMAAYGHAIFDALVDVEGIDVPALIRACGEAYNWAVGSGLGEQEVSAAEDFSAAPSSGA